MSKIPKCNPEVYRRAAELIDSDLVYYSCNAVCKAASKLGYSRRSADYYITQYEAALGNRKDPKIVKDNAYKSFYVTGRYVRHPFWNQAFSETRKQYRVHALLLMAELCENA